MRKPEPDPYKNYLEELERDTSLILNPLPAQRAALEFDLWWREEHPLSEEPEFSLEAERTNKELESTRQELDAVREELARLKRYSSDIHKIEELSDEVHRLTEARIQLAEELARLRLENEQLRQSRLSAESQIDELQRQLAAAQQAYDANLRHLERQNTTLSETNRFLQAEHARLSSRLEILEKEYQAGARASRRPSELGSHEVEARIRALVQFLEMKIQEVQSQREDDSQNLRSLLEALIQWRGEEKP